MLRLRLRLHPRKYWKFVLHELKCNQVLEMKKDPSAFLYLHSEEGNTSQEVNGGLEVL